MANKKLASALARTAIKSMREAAKNITPEGQQSVKKVTKPSLQDSGLAIDGALNAAAQGIAMPVRKPAGANLLSAAKTGTPAKTPADIYKETLANLIAYGNKGPEARLDLASALASGAITAPTNGNLNDLSDAATRRMIIDNIRYGNDLAATGMFNTPEIVFNKGTTYLADTTYMQELQKMLRQQYDDSLKMDEKMAADFAATQENASKWRSVYDAVQNQKDAGDEWYNLLYIDWLLGDQNQQFDFEAIDKLYDEDHMDQATYDAEMARLRKQRDDLDWETLTGSKSGRYESQTDILKAQMDYLDSYLGTRTSVDELEALARSNPEFALNSKYRGDKWTYGVNDEMLYQSPYAYINNVGDNIADVYAATHQKKINWATRMMEDYNSPYVDKGYEYMTPDEIAIYNTLFHTDQQKAAAYLEAMSGELYGRRAKANESMWSTLASHPALAVALQPIVRGLDQVNIGDRLMQTAAALTGNDDPNAPWYDSANAKQYFDQEIIGNLGNVEWANGLKIDDKNLLQHLYGAGTGLTDSAIPMFLDWLYGGTGTLNQILNAGRGYSAGLQEGAERDLSIGQTMASGAGNAIIGWLTEKIGLDPGKLGGGTSNLMNFISEGAEELLEAIGTDAKDMILSNMFGTQSNFDAAVEERRIAGDKDAVRHVLQDKLAEYATETVYGGIAGFGMGLPGNIAQSASNRETGRAIQQQGDPDRMLGIAKSMPEGSEARRIAENIEENVSGGKQMSLADLGRMTNALAGELRGEYGSTVKQVMNDAIANRLVEVGSTPEKARSNADAIRKIANGENITLTERAGLMWDDAASQVTREMTREMNEGKHPVEGRSPADPEGTRTGQGWVTKAKLDQIVKTEEVEGKMRQAQAAANTKNVSTTVKEAVKRGADKVEVGKNGQPTAKETDRNITYVDGDATGSGRLARFEEVDGKLTMAIETGKGKDGKANTVNVPLNSLNKASGKGTAGLIEAVSDINENLHPVSAEEASTMLATYELTGGDVGAFVENYEKAYLAGYSGVDNSSVAIDPKLAQMAKEAGQRQAEKDEQQRLQRAGDYKALETTVAGWLGKVSDNSQVHGMGDADALSGALERMTETQRRTAEICLNLGKALGLNVVLFESDVKNLRGIRNGSFDEATHTVYLDINSGVGSMADMESKRNSGTLGAAMLRVMSHELTHYLEVASPEMYAKYKAAVRAGLKAAGKETDLAVLMREKIDRALNAGRKMSYKAAEAEVIADASEYMLKDSKFTNDLDPTLKGKIKSFIQNFAQKVKEIFQHLTGGHKESAALREMKDGVLRYMDGLQDLWDAGFDEIMGKGTTEQVDADADTAQQAVEGGVQYSDRDKNSPEQASIKAQIREIQEELNMMDVVASVVAPDLSQMNTKQRKDWVMGTLKSSGYKTEVQGFGVVEYGENQIDSSLNYLNSMEEVAAFLCLPRVLKRGIRTHGHENHKGRSFDTVTFAAPVEINGVRGNMAVVVKQIKRNLYKTHRILMPDGSAFSFDNKKAESTPAVGTPPMREAQETRINSANISIASSEEHVNPGMKNSDREQDQTETEAFKRWFGDSEVVDSYGKPRIVYHTTRNEFTEFDPDRIGKSAGNASDGYLAATAHLGYWFNTQPLDNRGMGNNVMQVYLSAQHLHEPGTLDGLTAEIWDVYGQQGYEYDTEDPTDEQAKEAGEVYRDWLESRGYDGIAVDDTEFGGTSYVVFEPTQIKSATKNVGTFDPENPDIRYSDRDLPDSITVREYLSGLKPTSRMNETEKILLKRYQEKLALLEEKEKLVAEQEEIIRTAPFRNPDGSLNDEITKAKNRYKIYRDQANRISRELLNYERDEGFAGIMATGRQVVQELTMGSAGGIADAADALETEVADLTARLTKLEADVTRTAAAQRTAFARGLYDPKALNAAAQQLKDTYGSRMSVKSIADRLALTFGELYANEGPEGARLFSAAAKELAMDLLQGNKFRYKSEILPMLREKIGSISLTETDVQEIENRGYTLREYKNMLSPYIKVTTGGSDLSSVASNANYFEDGELAAVLEDETEGNLAMRLYEVISREKAREAEIAYEGMTEAQLIGMAMADIAGANLPVSANNQTVEYLRKELLKYAGENTDVAIAVEEAISKAKTTTANASNVWREAVKHTDTALQAVEYYRKLEEQRRLLDLAEQKKSLTEQLKSDHAQKLKEKVEAQRAEYREREQKAREYRKSRVELDKVRKRISRNVKTINALRVRETDKKHVPQQLQVVADLLMQTFADTNLGRLAFPQEKLDSLSRTYRLLLNEEADATYYWDDEIEADIENLRALSEAYSGLKNKQDGAPSVFTLEGVEYETEILRGVDNVVANVLNMIDAANDNFLRNRTETFETFANQTGEKLRKRDDHKVKKGWLGKMQTMLDETIRTGNVTPVYFFEHLENPEMLAVFDEIREGMRKAAMIEREGKEFIEKARANRHYGKWVADGRLKMKTGNGHTIELTREEAAEIYAIAKREKTNKLYQTEHLLYGGFQYKHIDQHIAEDGKHLVQDIPHQLDAADLEKIGNWLTDEQKAYADDLVGFLSTRMAEYGNEASMAMYGYEKFNEAYYIPFRTVAEQRYLRGDEGPQGENAGTGRLLNSGFTKKLQHGANATLYVGGISETVAEHIHKMAAYSAMVQPIENMKRLLNHKVLENDGTTNTIRALVGQKYGKASEDYLTQLLKDLNGATQSDQRAAGFTDKLVGAFKRGAVMASASVVLQQPTAMARAMAMISPKYFAQNPFYRPSKGTWEKMMKYSGTAVIKDMGKFDVGMGLTASQYILDEDLSAVEAYQRLKAESKTKAGKAAYDRFMAWLTAAPGVADQWTWGLIWKAAEAETAALNPGIDRNSEEFLRLVGQRFDDVIDHTQVYDSVLSRSNLMRSTNALHKMATSFMSEPTLSLNMLYDAITGKHGKKQGARIIGSVVASQVLAGALAALAQAWNDDDDERNWAEKYMDRAAGNVLDNLNPLGMIPYISDIVSLFEGYEVERPDMSVIADIYDYSKTFFKAFEDGGTPSWKQIENFAGTWANLTGVPLKNISREIRRTWNAVTKTDWGTPNTFNVGHAMLENTFWYSEKNAEYYQRMVTAHLNGDTELESDFRTYMLTSKMVSEESMMNGLQTAMQERYLDGDVDDDTAIKYLVQIGKAEDEEDAYWTVDKWQYMKETGNTAQSYRKYDEFFAAVESGTNLKATIQEYMDNGVSKTTLATQITNEYKPQLIALKQSGKGYTDLQARILTAYEALGYDRQKKLKDIQKWFEDKK